MRILEICRRSCSNSKSCSQSGNNGFFGMKKGDYFRFSVLKYFPCAMLSRKQTARRLAERWTELRRSVKKSENVMILL